MKIFLSVPLVVLGLAGSQDPAGKRATLGLKEEEMWIEYTATLDEATLVLHAEAESRVGHVEVCDPTGQPILRLWSPPDRDRALSGFVIETIEATPELLRQTYPEGTYELQGETVEGRRLTGSARLSHALPAIPQGIFPQEGAVGVPTDATVTWDRDPLAKGYRIVVEQDENDGLVVELPPAAHSFRIPEGVLKPRTRTLLEVGVIGENQNTTVVEITFWT